MTPLPGRPGSSTEGKEDLTAASLHTSGHIHGAAGLGKLPFWKGRVFQVQSHGQEGEEKHRHRSEVPCPDSVPEELGAPSGERERPNAFDVTAHTTGA